MDEEGSQSEGQNSAGSTIHARHSILPTRAEDASDSDGIPDVERQQSAETSVSLEEANNIDRDAIPRILEVLDGAAIQLIDSVLSNDSSLRDTRWNALLDPKSQQRKRIVRELRLLDSQLDELSDRSFIRPQVIHRAILGDSYESSQEDHDFGGLDAILQRANLIKIVSSLLPVNDNAIEHLEGLEQTFDMLVGYEEPTRELFDINLQLTVIAILRDLAASTALSFRDILAKYFEQISYGDDDYQLVPFFAIPGACAEGFDGLASHHEGLSEVITTFTTFADADRAQLISAVRSLHPEEALRAVLLSFAHDRSAQLARLIGAYGGSQNIISSIKELIIEAEESNERRKLHAKLARGSDWAHGKVTKSGISALKQRLRTVQPEPQPTIEEPPVAPRVSPARQTRVQQSTPRSGSRRTPVRSATKKSPHKTPTHIQQVLQEESPSEADVNRNNDDGFAEIDPTQDDGFQADIRGSTIANQRREAQKDLLRQNARAAKQVPITESRSPATPRAQHESTSVPIRTPKQRQQQVGKPSPAVPQRDARATTHERELSASIASSANIRDQLHQALNMSAQARLRNGDLRPTKERKAWTAEEEQRLHELICDEEKLDEKLSYAAMLEADAGTDHPLLQHRRAEDLRFKARNMKTTFYRYGSYCLS